MTRKKKKKESLGEAPLKEVKSSTVKKVGNIPEGYSEKSVLFMEDGKIYIK